MGDPHMQTVRSPFVQALCAISVVLFAAGCSAGSDGSASVTPTAAALATSAPATNPPTAQAAAPTSAAQAVAPTSAAQTTAARPQGQSGSAGGGATTSSAPPAVPVAQ